MSKTEEEKLRILLGYWMEHNKEHREEFKEWAEKSKKFGEIIVHAELLKATQQMDKANQFLLKALRKLEKKSS